MAKIARRTFLGVTAGAAAGLVRSGTSRGHGSTRESAAPATTFELGLASYTFREFDLDATLAMAQRLGLRRIALKDMHLPLDSPDALIRATVAKAAALGIVPYGCGVVYMTNEAEVDRAFAYARAAGMGVIVGVPEHTLLARAEKCVRDTGIRLAIHNHGPGDRRYPTPRSILDRVGSLDPRIGVCLDVGHCERSGLDPSAAAVACGSRLLDVHLKDVTAASEAGVAVEVGRGVVDIPRLLRTLRGMGFRGTAAFEYEKDGRDPLPGLAESVGYVRGVLAASDPGRKI